MVCGEANHKSDSLRADREVERVNLGNLGLFDSGVNMCVKCVTDGADNASFLHSRHPNVLTRYGSSTNLNPSSVAAL